MNAKTISVLLFCLVLFGCSTIRPDSPSRQGESVASWYGRDFHGRPTSSGEPYDMYSNTCAHKEYPFGTRLRVTNLNNGRTCLCTVNDRGPFVAGRVLDLSYAAAKEIGMIGAGTAPVRLDVAGRDESYVGKVKVRTDALNGPFAIQLGSFSDASNAERLKQGLNLKYENVYVQEADIGGTTYYRVRIGDFGNMQAAMAVAGKLAEEGYQSVVMRASVRI